VVLELGRSGRYRELLAMVEEEGNGVGWAVITAPDQLL
jgi:hypothetical protein